MQVVIEVLFLAVAAAVAQVNQYGTPEPFAWAHGENRTGNPTVASSPDPQVRWTWSNLTSPSTLQQMAVHPIGYSAHPPEAFEGLASVTNPSGNVDLLVKAEGWIRLDFGVERYSNVCVCVV